MTDTADLREREASEPSTLQLLEHRVAEMTVRFAGDSGDGMQLAGTQFATNAALAGSDVSTLTDFPAEIRAPQGTLGGVSGFQVHFGGGDIVSPGDVCNVLVAMNAAALKANLSSLAQGGTIIANSAGFDEKNLRLAKYVNAEGNLVNPLENGLLTAYQVIVVDISKHNALALREGMFATPLSAKALDQTKNMFALGLVYWLFSQPLEPTLGWIREKFAAKPNTMLANTLALQAGWNMGETAELFTSRYRVEKASMLPGRYRTITGNVATAYGLVAAAQKARLELFLGSYPITPATDILHTLAPLKSYRVKTFQAEDEIAAITSALGASYGGALAATSTSGPGLALKTEALGLAVMAELPLVVIDVQRAGPSTGMPTKVEQADLFQAMYGRHGEAPLPVIAPATPAECFSMAFEASRLAVKYMTPVIMLSDAYLANSAEAWRVPNPDELPTIEPHLTSKTFVNGFAPSFDEQHHFLPYSRDAHTLARPWAVPGTPGLEHRIGGLEKEHLTGNVSHDAQNHQAMVSLRANKIRRIALDIPPANVEPNSPEEGEVLVVGWGSTYGAISSAVQLQRSVGMKVAHLHLRYINPFPHNLGEILVRFHYILVAELNTGQLLSMLRSRYLLPATGINKVQGQPFKSSDIAAAIACVTQCGSIA